MKSTTSTIRRRGGAGGRIRRRTTGGTSPLMVLSIFLLSIFGIFGMSMFLLLHTFPSDNPSLEGQQQEQQQQGNIAKRSVVGVANLIRNRHFSLPHIGNVLRKDQQHPKSSVGNENQSKKTIVGSTGRLFPYYPEHMKLVSPTHDFSDFLPDGGSRFDEYKDGDVVSPYTYTEGESDELAKSRRYHVKKAMEHAWNGYKTRAFGFDELAPQNGFGNNRWGGLGITLIDSLDTLWLMGMKDEFLEAQGWVQKHLNHNKNVRVSVFETTIRSLGGLLAAYDWSGQSVFLEQAHDLGNRLFAAFDDRMTNGIPLNQVSLEDGRHTDGMIASSTVIAEAGTLQLEFRLLARLTGNLDYKTKSEHVFELLRDMNPSDGLYPYRIRNSKSNPKPVFANNQLTFGAMADSVYEYMLKVWLQGGRKEMMYREMYDRAIQGMHDVLLQKSTPSGLTFIADRNGGRLDTKMDHLVCFMGGLLALGAYTDPLGLESERAQRDLKTGKALTYTCYQMYARMSTGISAEYVQFQPNHDFAIGHGAPHYLLRPETVESFFVLYQLTKDPIYREWGWEVFQAIERFCRTKYGYGALNDVNPEDVSHVNPRDSMESFFLAETIKYLYLLFDPDTPIDLLHKHVFNTEAHPLRIFPILDEEGVPDLLSRHAKSVRS